MAAAMTLKEGMSPAWGQCCDYCRNDKRWRHRGAQRERAAIVALAATAHAGLSDR